MFGHIVDEVEDGVVMGDVVLLGVQNGIPVVSGDDSSAQLLSFFVSREGGCNLGVYR